MSSYTLRNICEVQSIQVLRNTMDGTTLLVVQELTLKMLGAVGGLFLVSSLPLL